MRIVIALLLPFLLRGADPARELARECLKELVEINTTDSSGSVTRAAEAVARRLHAAGFDAGDAQVIEPAPGKGNLVARIRGTGSGRPILFIAHLDVVEARREDWTSDPFTLLEKDGWFYGRGTSDNKGDASLLVANFARLKREGFRPARDLILALTADEEGGRGPNGVEWLLDNRRPLIDAEFCVNVDSGGGQTRKGRRLLYSLQAAEKTYATFRVRAKNPGGHSSLPTRDNAIYEVAAALVRIRDVRFPPRLLPVTRDFFERMGAIESGQPAADMRAVAGVVPDEAAIGRLSAASPYYNALLHDTCVATMISGGDAENALPQSVEAAVNCRLIPGNTVDGVASRLREAAGSSVEIVAPRRTGDNPASPWPPPFAPALERVVKSMWPGLPVVPVMETGGTDGKPLRRAGIPTYGLSAIFGDVDDVRAHGRDERIAVEAFYEGLEFNYRLIKALAGN